MCLDGVDVGNGVEMKEQRNRPPLYVKKEENGFKLMVRGTPYWLINVNYAGDEIILQCDNPGGMENFPIVLKEVKTSFPENSRKFVIRWKAQRPNSIGDLQFCPRCNKLTLYFQPDENEAKCTACGLKMVPQDSDGLWYVETRQ